MAAETVNDLVPDPKRIAVDLAALGGVGRQGETGVTRLAYTPEDESAREYLIDRMRQEGLEVRIDSFGNIIGRLGGRDPTLPPLLIGSHIDTPPLGGQFDGTVGVLGGLEVIRLLQEQGQRPLRPVELISFQAEEPGRFGVSCLGSKAMAGKFGVEYLRSLKDRAGVTLYEAIRSVGLDPDNLPSARRTQGSAHAYLELHIEQGRVLEDAGLPIGIVTAIAGPTRAMVTLEGQADHSGATPMNLRRDALCGACELVLALERLGRSELEAGTVTTVGVLQVEPGALNVVPGKVTFSVDLRGVDVPSKERVKAAFSRLIDQVGSERGLQVTISYSVDEPPVPCDPHVVDLFASACEVGGIPHRKMPSGAGHDAQHVAAFCPAGMIFIPCREGISHAPEEHATIDEIALGVRVLARAAHRLAFA